MVVPPESLQDKIAFTFNNLSQMNLTVKVSAFFKLEFRMARTKLSKRYEVMMMICKSSKMTVHCLMIFF